jgi:hypothetical protein
VLFEQRLGGRVVAVLAQASSAVTAWMPLSMRSRFFALISWMPGISW